MGSMHWTSEESRYLKAIFTWQDRFDDEQDGGSRVRDAAVKAGVGDLRVLIIGAQGVGKTALMTRFCADLFADRSDGSGAPDERFTHGGRQPIRIDSYFYNMDVLEMPSQHLVDLDLESESVDANADADADADTDTEWPVFASSNPTRTRRRGHYRSHSARTPAAMMLEQALAITEAAIVVYDVCDPASFQQASRLYERLLCERGDNQAQGEIEAEQKEGQQGTATTRATHTSTPTGPKPKQRSTMRIRGYKRHRQRQAEAVPHEPHPTKARPPRPFALFLVGNKSDVDDSARRVAWAEGYNVASTNKMASGSAFVEASAKTGDKVGDVFVQIGRDILEQRAQAKTAVSKQQQQVEEQAYNSTTHVTGRESSSTSSSKSKIKSQAPRRPFMLRVLGLSFGRRHTAV